MRVVLPVWFGRDHNTDGIAMDLFETNTHPFVVKIWLEETAEEAGRVTWRGHITHVLTGDYRYVQKLCDISAFIGAYMLKMGVRCGPLWRLRQRLIRWMSPL